MICDRNRFDDVFFVGCAGIPGVGKSTALKRLESSGYLGEEIRKLNNQMPFIKVAFVQEPSELWRKSGWLQEFFSNPSHYAAAFQMLVFDSYINAIESVLQDLPKEGDNVTVVVIERTFYCQRLFWEQHVESGCATATGMYREAYERMWQRWRRIFPEPSLIFLFQTTQLHETMRRVHERARAEEVPAKNAVETESKVADKDGPTSAAGGLTLEYQQQLLDKHRKWFAEPTARPFCSPSEGIPCVHINADAPYADDDSSLRGLAKTIAGHVWEELIAKTKAAGPRQNKQTN